MGGALKAMDGQTEPFYKWRRLGTSGPVYEVLDWDRPGDLVQIRVVESGEQARHKRDDILNDPEER